MTTGTVNLPEKLSRTFLPQNLNISDWSSLEKFYADLADRPLENADDLKAWLADMSELESVVEEHAGWLYIRMTCNTQEKSLAEAYAYFVEEINPKIAPYNDRLNRKLAGCPFSSELDKSFRLYLRQIENSIRIFREENIPLEAELSILEKKYGEIAGAMTVDIDGKTLTLQQAANYLKVPDRAKRQTVFRMIAGRRLQDRQALDNLFDDLIDLRKRIAANAGFSNFRDYKFVELDRFDYTPEDCYDFHASVAKSVVPVLEILMDERKAEMKLPVLKPWDLEADPQGRHDLHPFDKGTELIEKSIRCFDSVHPYFGDVLRTLKAKGFTDLDSRIGKAPGGYNYPLYESGVPFIFMNASGSLRDVITMVHEGGHAIHSMLTRDLDFIGFKELPSEIAELASMGMELISMEHWHHFFEDQAELLRARREHLENVLEVLPWIATIDSFQHWIYTNPDHTADERTAEWKKICLNFSSKQVDWSEDTEALGYLWQKQLHLYEVPFYYIEYGMAQLGAIALWRNYKQDPEKAVRQYMDALSLGYSKPIPEVYKAAGISFDFSEKYIRELMDFVVAEIRKL